MASESSSKSLEYLARIDELAPKDNVRLQAALAALRQSLTGDAKEREQAEQQLKEFEEAYLKLTQPANRLGVFLQWVEDQEAKHALIAVGDTEFLSSVDPKIQEEPLQTGTRVRVNEAYAVVGTMPVSGGGAIARVAEALEDGRLRIGNDTPGGEGRFLLRGSMLKEAAIQTGDEVRLDSTGKIALEHMPKSESRDYFLEEVPDLPWEKVGGQAEAIKLIRETIELPLLHPELFKQYDKKPVKGILLYGPPGCGKTLIGKATAHNLTKEYSERVGKPVKEYFMAISGPKILNMWLGETERMVREIFKTAREKAKEGRLVFIFMDEAESLLRTRSGGRYLNISNTVVPQFCAELDGLVALENVVLMLTSNRPDYIDPAILRPERIDRKVKINRPEKDAAAQILGIYLHAGIPLDKSVLTEFDGEVDCARKALVEATVDRIWRKDKANEFLKVSMRNGTQETLYYKDMVSGALLKSVVDRAKDTAIKRAISEPNGGHGVRQQDLLDAVEQEYKENEIFPKSDSMEDWLQLLDQNPEQVAAVRPVGASDAKQPRGRNVV